MPTNDLETLMRSIVEGLSPQMTSDNTSFITAPADSDRKTSDRGSNEASAAEKAIERVLQPLVAQSAPPREATGDAGRLSAEFEELRRVVTQRTTTTQPTNTSASRNTDSDGGSTVETVLKTFGMATGIGPLATGLMALFGRGSSTAEALPATLFEPPPAIAVEAGLTSDRQFTRISYGADGVARSAGNPRSAPAATPPIQINVQAMDSRSFMDHSDDIARAVQQAMLHSHALNDVVSEL
jgi:hypothetical protein